MPYIGVIITSPRELVCCAKGLSTKDMTSNYTTLSKIEWKVVKWEGVEKNESHQQETTDSLIDLADTLCC